MNCTKRTQIVATTCALLVSLSTVTGQVADGPPTGKGNGKETLLERPEVVPTDGNAQSTDKPDHPSRPPHPNRPVRSDSVNEMVAEFQKARNAFLAERARLLEDLKKASKEERKAIRERLNESLRDWIEERKERAQEAARQAREMNDRIEDLKDVIDSARDEGRGRDR